jgi:hypothetical protein
MMLHWHIFQYMNNDNLQAMLGLVLSEITYIQDSFETLKVGGALDWQSTVFTLVTTPLFSSDPTLINNRQNCTLDHVQSFA